MGTYLPKLLIIPIDVHPVLFASFVSNVLRPGYGMTTLTVSMKSSVEDAPASVRSFPSRKYGVNKCKRERAYRRDILVITAAVAVLVECTVATNGMVSYSTSSVRSR